VPIDPRTPKYAEIINTIQTRIERGAYGVGAMLPSEAQLVREFGASRSTVVRALEYLRLHGWLQGVQGKGRIVLHPPAADLLRSPGRAIHLLRPSGFAEVSLLDVSRVAASPAHATALALPVGAPLVCRRSLLRRPSSGPVGLSVAYVPLDLAAVAGLDVSRSPAAVDLLEVLGSIGQPARRVVERVGVRLPAPAEATDLGIRRGHCLLMVLLVVLDGAGRPLLLVDSALSRDLPELIAVSALA
jgi:GntR family transcriptional regulator